VKYPSRQRAIVAAIASARREAQLSQRQLAQKLGVPPNWIQRVESLQRRVDVAEFIAIARAVNVDPCALLARVVRPT
jgi:transcriptional regulator with XRE-family HTH domain